MSKEKIGIFNTPFRLKIEINMNDVEKFIYKDIIGILETVLFNIAVGERNFLLPTNF